MSRKSVDGLTRRQIVARIFEYASQAEIVRSLGHTIEWGEMYRDHPDGRCLSNVRGPAHALWMFSHGINPDECDRLVPVSWDVSPDEWRLSRV